MFQPVCTDKVFGTHNLKAPEAQYYFFLLLMGRPDIADSELENAYLAAGHHSSYAAKKPAVTEFRTF